MVMEGCCTAVCYTSDGDVVAGTVDGHLCLYNKGKEFKENCKAPGGVWSVCEYKRLIYVYCGESTVIVYTYDLQKTLKAWEMKQTDNQMTVSNESVYVIHSEHKSITKTNLRGDPDGFVKHPSFVFVSKIKQFERNSIVVCDRNANAIFLFKNDRCIWQIEIENCSGVAVDLEAGNIWVKVFNRRMVTALSRKGELLVD